MDNCPEAQVSRGEVGWTFGSSKEVQARNYSTERDSPLSEAYGIAHQETALSETGEGDCTGL